MKIFWSWQSDTPGKTGRYLIRDALKQAIDQLKQVPDVEEPTTRENREALHLDQDIFGVTGSPDLARTIFDKIDLSNVVIADVTLTGHIPDSTDATGAPIPSKKLINSNVAIELGYALRALTDRNVLMVFNEHYGSHNDLPFDLRHKGGSIVFSLSPTADRKRIDDARKVLKDRFVGTLKPYLSQATAAPILFLETPSTFNKAAYFGKGEVLARIGEPNIDEVSFSYASKSLCYIRLIPTTRLASPLPPATLIRAVQHAPVLSSAHNVESYHNKHGVIAYEPGPPPPGGRAKLKASTQLFHNGEIWSVGASLIIAERNGRPLSQKLPLLPCSLFEHVYRNTVQSLVRFAADHLGLGPPWQVEFGLVGCDGLYLGVRADDQWGPMRDPEIIQRTILNEDSPETLDKLILNFFSKVFDSTGYPRPENLHGFPPQRPAS